MPTRWSSRTSGSSAGSCSTTAGLRTPRPPASRHRLPSTGHAVLVGDVGLVATDPAVQGHGACAPMTRWPSGVRVDDDLIFGDDRIEY